MWIRRIFSFDSNRLELLLLSLSPEDRRFRFSAPVNDDSIQRYVRSLKWRQICVYGMFDKTGTLVGAVELVPTGSGTELAIAVCSTQKRRGIGRALMSRAMLHAKVRGLKRLQILCTSDNAAMQNLARGVGMTLMREYGEIEGRVKVGSPTPADYMSATWCQVDATVGSSLIWVGDAFQLYRNLLRSFRPL
jgi:ribosomal protein S18 acetylase RimI-like enzyme